jgi:hypothetical protein
MQVSYSPVVVLLYLKKVNDAWATVVTVVEGFFQAKVDPSNLQLMITPFELVLQWSISSVTMTKW